MLVILTTHPIQYQVPLWQALARDGRVPFEVWYLTPHGTHASYDREFGESFSWDIDLLSGYPHKFLDDVRAGTAPGEFWKCRLRPKFGDRLRSSGATVLWVQGWQVAAYWQAVWEAHAAGIEVWLRGESNDLASTPWWKKPLRRLMLGRLFERVDRFLTIGSANRRLYRKFGIADSRLHPAPYAVDTERFARQAAALRPQRQPLRQDWGIADDAFCVLFAGKFIPKKRPLDLVAAAELLTAAHRQAGSRPIHLLFAGAGELADSIRARCNVRFDTQPADARSRVSPQAGTRPRATLAGFLNQTEISKAYVAADCLALPSDHRETWGLVANEAIASGLPCAVSDACGCAEDLARSDSLATVFRCGIPESLAEALRTIQARTTTSHLEPFDANNTYATTVETVARCYRSMTERASI
jgi:glycosyltransferase involved in cell wall biosynthesis